MGFEVAAEREHFFLQRAQLPRVCDRTAVEFAVLRPDLGAGGLRFRLGDFALLDGLVEELLLGVEFGGEGGGGGRVAALLVEALQPLDHGVMAEVDGLESDYLGDINHWIPAAIRRCEYTNRCSRVASGGADRWGRLVAW